MFKTFGGGKGGSFSKASPGPGGYTLPDGSMPKLVDHSHLAVI